MARKPKGESSPHEKIVAEAKERFARCEEYESDFRKLFVEDLRFANGDSDNNWQWPDPILNARGDRPHLTVNKVRQHNLQIVNDAKQNKPSVKTLPVDGEADIEIAKILDGMVRHIEYNSHAEIVYDTGTEFQVQGGLGYWRIVCEYAHDGSFDQEIFLRRVKDPLTIYLDCDIESTAPIQGIYRVTQTLTPAQVAANTSAEQTFTVPGLQVGDSIDVNKPSHQVGLSIGNVRVSAANTLAIQYVNTTASAITPATEQYIIGGQR
ncbi:hypothetical protein MJ435_18580, partial [Burkholderia gladioli]